MSEKALRLDMDYTLLDTDAFFFRDGLNLLESEFNVDKSAFEERMADFAGTVGARGGVYDFYEQITAEGLNADKVEAAFKANLTSNDYLRPGVIEFLDSIAPYYPDRRVTTKGADRYQLTKFGCVPLLGSMGVDVMLGSKGLHLMQEVGNRPGILVDDTECTDLPPQMVQARMEGPSTPAGEGYADFYALMADWHNVDPDFTQQ